MLTRLACTCIHIVRLFNLGKVRQADGGRFVEAVVAISQCCCSYVAYMEKGIVVLETCLVASGSACTVVTCGGVNGSGSAFLLAPD